MQTYTQVYENLKEKKALLEDKYGVCSIAIFGSYAREEQTDESDVDILVDFNKSIGVEFIDLADELENILQIKVDLISKNGIKNEYFKQIESELNYV